MVGVLIWGELAVVVGSPWSIFGCPIEATWLAAASFRPPAEAGSLSPCLPKSHGDWFCVSK